MNSSADDRESAIGSDLASEIAILKPSDDGRALGWLSHYEVLGVLGRGGMGVVLRARDTKLDRVVAIKILGRKSVDDPAARSRFLREARAVAAICHDHVVALHGVDTVDDVPFLVMEFVDGDSLEQRIQRCGALDPQVVARVGVQVADALAAAHQLGIIHRDIKPANVMLEGDESCVRLTDFGLAHVPDELQLTTEGTWLGTPNHVSPEQALGKPIDHRSDLFSLGTVMYAMCTGRLPFEGKTPISVLYSVRHEKPTPIQEINASAPEWLVQIIDRLMAKSPDNRYQSAAELRDQLQRHFSDPSTSMSVTSGTHSVASKGQLSWLLAASFMVVVVGSVALLPGLPSPEKAALESLVMETDVSSGIAEQPSRAISNERKNAPDHLLTSSLHEWSTPVNLGATINTDYQESHPSLTEDGLSLVFCSKAHSSGVGKLDIWECHRETTEEPWGNPVNLGPQVNSPLADRAPWISFDGLVLWFQSLRPSEDGNSSIWTCQRKSRDQPWSQVRQVTLPGVGFVGGFGPCVSKDGLTMMLGRDVDGEKDIWRFHRKTLDQPWSSGVKLNSRVNNPNTVEARASLTFDSRALLFHSDRSGVTRLWASTRNDPKVAWRQSVPLDVQLEESTEMFHPFYHPGTNTLYFTAAVNGSGNGMDLWMCRRVPKVDQ